MFALKSKLGPALSLMAVLAAGGDLSGSVGLVIAAEKPPLADGEDDDIARKLKELKPEEPAGEEDDGTPLAAGSILDTRSLWRFRTVRETPEVVGPDGAVVHGTAVALEGAKGWFSKNPDKGSLPPDKFKVQPVEKSRVRPLPSDTPADWMKPDFDDSAWARARGPVLGNFFSEDDEWKLILMRGRFEVTDPGRAGELSLSMAFRGGVVVYLNGEEVHRAFMPKGALSLTTPAEPYPLSAYFTTDGFVLPWGRQTTKRELSQRPQDVRDRVASRTRRVEDVKLPGSKLRKGANVLAVSIHRAPATAEFFVSRPKGRTGMHSDLWWTRLGLVSVNLKAQPGSSVIPNVGPATGAGFAVWNHNCAQKVSVRDYPEPLVRLRPVRLSGVRNGTFAGQVVVGDGKPLKGLKAAASDLKGPGIIPASAVRVRYGVADGGGGRFDSLEDVPPEEVPVNATSGRAVLPLWITVTVPADAKAGDYEGAVTVSAAGVGPVAVPLQIRVADWSLPPASEYVLCMDFMQSPETVAMAYDVPLWSEEHLKLLDRTFELLGAMANKTLFVTCIRRTHMGNEHAMVRWVRDEGELRPDFTIVEKYLDVAMKHMGKIPGVILYCWEPPESQGHAGGAGTARRVYDKPILYTLYDPESKECSPREGPAWGTPEAREFWKKLTDGIQPVLEKRGLKGSMLFGLIGDARPTKQAMDDICNGVPGARWAVHSHYRVETWQGHRMGMAIALWGLGYTPEDPEKGYSFGWSNPQWLSYYPREMSLGSTLTEYRSKAEAYIGARRGKEFISKGAGPRGLGRLGADFWEVLKDSRGRPRGTLAGRYPEAAWGQLNLNFGVPRVLGMGRKGPIPTVRSESFREAAQEIEARAYVEKALLDRGATELLGEELTKRCREALDDRIRFANRCAVYRGGGEGEIWYIGSGWRERAELLFGLAAEVKARYGGKDPVPDLSSEVKEEPADRDN